MLTTDAELRSFSPCTTITGDLIIGDRTCSAACSVTDLSPLNANLTAVEGSLRIQCCNSLTEIPDFSRLSRVNGTVEIYYNANLMNIGPTAFIELTDGVSSIVVSQNQRLRSINGFQRVSSIAGYLQIDRNGALTEIEGLGNLQTIRGDVLVEGHALAVLYNSELERLSGLSNVFISYGTVHVEGNTKLCYAGYPRWSVGSYSPRLPPGGGDQGIDWRTRLNASLPWQFAWGSGGIPSLVVQGNGDAETCGERPISGSNLVFGCT